MLTFLALGDSFTIGEAVSEAERWPMQLISRLRQHGIQIADPEIIATTGWTTDELAAGITVANPQGTYDLVTLLIGVNNQYRGWPLATYQTEFADLVQQAIRFAAGQPERVIVISIPDWSQVPFVAQEQRTPAQISAEVAAFNEINRAEAATAVVNYVDITAGFRQATNDPTLVAADGLHPSGKMYTDWVKQIWPVAVKILDDLNEEIC
jgi:lysophospholipase L1-like esterase